MNVNVLVVKISYIFMFTSMWRKVVRNFELHKFCFYVVCFRIVTSLTFLQLVSLDTRFHCIFQKMLLEKLHSSVLHTRT